MSRSKYIYLIGVAVFLMLGALPAVAQAERDCSSNCIEGFSAILSSTSSSEIDTFSETFVSPDLAVNYAAFVAGFIYENDTEINKGCADGLKTAIETTTTCATGPKFYDAYGTLSSPLVAGNTYTIESDHYLWTYHYYIDPYSGYVSYYNPVRFGFSQDTGGYDPSGWNYTSSGTGDVYIAYDFIYIGTTGVKMSSAKPAISSISPSGGSLGTNGQITIEGSDLVDVFTGETTPSITGTGISLSVYDRSESQVILDYTISEDASRGQQNLTLSTRFGTSNTVPFTVGDASPTVSSISPDVWDAGSTINVSIKGTGFGSKPSLDISFSGTGVRLNNYSLTGINQISASVTIDPNVQDGTATITVTSNGYSGDGFLRTDPGQQDTVNNTASVQAIRAPVPKVVFGTDTSACSSGADITKTAQDVFVGQKIELVGCLPSGLPQGINISSHRWGTPSGAVVGGYEASNSRGAVLPLQGQTEANFGFFWIGAGVETRRLTYAYTLSNGSSNEATLTFNVKGPTAGGTDGGFFGFKQPSPVSIVPPTMFNEKSEPWIQMGDGHYTDGIRFWVSAKLPAESSDTPHQGTFQWVQIIESRRTQYRANPAVPDTVLEAGLDNWYPFISVLDDPTTAADSPGTELLPGAYEVADSFKATMYLMWDPTLPSMEQRAAGKTTCTAAANNNGKINLSDCQGSIPVPLGSVTWGFCGDAINTRLTSENGKNWISSCGEPTSPKSSFALNFPEWTKVNKNR